MSQFNAIGNKKVLIVTTGHPVAIVAPDFSQQANRVDIQALYTNEDPIIVGGSTIAADQSNGGMLLEAGDVYSVEIITNLAGIYVNGVAGEGVSITWWIGEVN